MGNTPNAKAEVRGSGTAIAAGGKGAGDHGIVADTVILGNSYEVRTYMGDKGPLTAQGMGDPAKFWNTALEGTVEVEVLRNMLLSADERDVESFKHQPARLVSVRGMLYPSGLMVSGFWESHFEKIEGLQWNDGVQQWLFQGFHSWGPSFDYSWHFDGDAAHDTAACVAQLGAGDEANSIPVILPRDKERKLADAFREEGRKMKAEVAPLVVTVQGVLCHRSQCPAAVQGKVGGILDYCLWLKEGEPTHKVIVEGRSTDMFSAYLWKCMVPKEVLDKRKPLLNDVYFVWEHTNLANEESVKYNLDSLEKKVGYVEHHRGQQMLMLQKSGVLIPGNPEWSKQEFYDLFLNVRDI